jgi:hypothetical protein
VSKVPLSPGPDAPVRTQGLVFAALVSEVPLPGGTRIVSKVPPSGVSVGHGAFLLASGSRELSAPLGFVGVVSEVPPSWELSAPLLGAKCPSVQPANDRIY